jgi:hypothetical protein
LPALPELPELVTFLVAESLSTSLKSSEFNMTIIKQNEIASEPTVDLSDQVISDNKENLDGPPPTGLTTTATTTTTSTGIQNQGAKRKDNNKIY